jgi:carboxypeptidase C (cathepsin A)
MGEDRRRNDTKDSAGDSGEKKDEKVRMLGIEPVETAHEIEVDGETVSYIARAGVIPLKDDEGETRAEVFFTSYESDDAEGPAERPLTFVFNGGPGSSSIWLHMGALGPRRVVMEPGGWMPAPPYRSEPNANTWLGKTDLVFVDPVGTGFSRPAKKKGYRDFLNYKGDIESVGEFIRLYLSRYGRWSSPLFLAGESYGTTRAAGLAEHLFGHGVAFCGIVLISTALDLRPIFFRGGDDLPYQLFVPTYTATAWYHRKLAPELQQRELPELLEEVEEWAESELTVALMKGDRLQESERRRIAARLAAYTGLGEDYVLGSNLRLNSSRFRRQLLRGERRSVGRLDSRYTGIEPLEVTETPQFDPSMTAIGPPYTSVFNDYLRRELRVDTDMEYTVMMRRQGDTGWEWDKGELPATGEKLRLAMAVNPHMRVMVAQGHYDLATPQLATRYMLSHMNVDGELRGNVSLRYYRAGHMFYLDTEALAAFGADAAEFIEAASRPKA